MIVKSWMCDMRGKRKRKISDFFSLTKWAVLPNTRKKKKKDKDKEKTYTK